MVVSRLLTFTSDGPVRDIILGLQRTLTISQQFHNKSMSFPQARKQITLNWGVNQLPLFDVLNRDRDTFLPQYGITLYEIPTESDTACHSLMCQTSLCVSLHKLFSICCLFWAFKRKRSVTTVYHSEPTEGLHVESVGLTLTH